MTRSRVTFGNAAANAFGFLVSDYGYTLTSQTDSIVAFANAPMLLQVLRDSRSYMVYVEVTRSDRNESFVLHEVLQVVAPNEAPNAHCSGANSSKLLNCLARLSQLCRDHLRNVLTADEDTLERLAVSAKRARDQYTLEAQYGALKDLANDAWDRKDWERARELYERARPALSPTEQRRLDFIVKSHG
jgi:hypothetical protein